jgi:prepilin-type N-terminal cleavage/methylation domain-containing protein
MKNKKGFTLIEVLAVIIILAVVAVIIAPKVNEYYKDSVKRKDLQSARGVRNALNQYFASTTGIFMGYTCRFPDDCSEIKLDGGVPTGGVVTITADGIISGYVRYDNNAFILNDEGVIAVNHVTNPGDVIDYAYSSSGEQTFLVTDAGYYKLEVWGAQGGSFSNISSEWGTLNYTGGYGGYSSGIAQLSADTLLYINVGGQGGGTGNFTYKDSAYLYGYSGGYNGGGTGGYGSYMGGAGGGGATSIALESGTLSYFDSNHNGVADAGEIGDILIVAGGGGGSAFGGTPGSGGGYQGGNGCCNGTACSSTGATQTTGYRFGLGGNGRDGRGYGQYSLEGAGGGGGGFYGGFTSQLTGEDTDFGGSGGSGYIGNSSLSDAIMFCYGCAESNTDGIKTVSTTGSSSLRDTTNCSSGYSSNAVSKCAKTGEGHARITYIGSSL